MTQRSILFDFDGVIVNSDDFNIAGLRHASKCVDVPFEDRDFELFFSGKRLAEGASDYLAHRNRTSRTKDFVHAKKDFDQQYLDYAQPYPQVLRIVKELAEEFQIGLVTGSRRVLVDMFVHTHGLSSTFDFIVAAEDVAKGKPNPDPYLQALEYCCPNLPDEVIAVEDSPAGVTAAKTAGLTCLAIATTHSASQLLAADLVATTTECLKPLLRADRETVRKIVQAQYWQD